ncbi:MAG TPA: DUF5752 family protein [Vicinamibacteria bacterium]|jgi:hypothetical protein
MSVKPYALYSCVDIRQIINRRAHGEQELLEGIEEVHEDSIYYHTHSYYLHGKYDYDLYPNDFATWVADDVRDRLLSERLAVLDPFQFENLEALREEIVNTIDDHINQLGFSPRALTGDAFHFFRAHIMSFPTGITVRSRKELSRAIRTAMPQTIYYHFFEDAFRKGSRSGSLVQWVADELGDQDLAEKLATFNPYRLHLERIRSELLSLIDGSPKDRGEAGAE